MNTRRSNAVQSRDLDEVVAAVKRWLEQPKNIAWLAIYDNHDNPKLKHNGKAKQIEQHDEARESDEDTMAAYDINSYLPNSCGGAILITTRSSRVGGYRIPLGKLRDLEDSLEILSHTSGREGVHKGKVPRETRWI
jgi:hypothetical protein